MTKSLCLERTLVGEGITIHKDILMSLQKWTVPQKKTIWPEFQSFPNTTKNLFKPWCKSSTSSDIDAKTSLRSRVIWFSARIPKDDGGFNEVTLASPIANGHLVVLRDASNVGLLKILLQGLIKNVKPPSLLRKRLFEISEGDVCCTDFAVLRRS